tara:strand:+ start:218986 stop:219186 length:201 start_codon:yes stop_codon:yes gene_type:complete
METITVNVSIIKWIVLGIILVGWWIWSKREARESGGGYLSGIEQLLPFIVMLIAIIGWLITFFVFL